MSKITPNSVTDLTDAEREALSKRGLAIYDERLKPILESKFDKKYVAIHVETADYEVADSSGNAMRAMRKRHPQGWLVMKRIGNEPEWGLAARLLVGKMMAGQQK